MVLGLTEIWHLDRFIHFYRAHQCAQHAYTDHGTCNVCSSRLHPCNAAMWPNNDDTCPLVRSMMLSECRSPTPRTYVATQYPAQDSRNCSIALSKLWCANTSDSCNISSAAATTTTLLPFNSLFSRTTWVRRYQKGNTSLDLDEVRDYGLFTSGGPYAKQSAPRSRQITTTTPHHSIFIDRVLFLTLNR